MNDKITPAMGQNWFSKQKKTQITTKSFHLGQIANIAAFSSNPGGEIIH